MLRGEVVVATQSLLCTRDCKAKFLQRAGFWASSARLGILVNLWEGLCEMSDGGGGRFVL